MRSQVFIPNNTSNCISKITESQLNSRQTSLYLGSRLATEPCILTEYRILAILTVGTGLEVHPPQGVVHKVVNIEDHPSENIAQHFSECNEFIKKNMECGNVLVHCRAGVSRSASVVLAFSMKTSRVRLSRAISQVQEARSVICPNPGFLGQLKEYERKLGKALEGKGLRLK